MFIIAGVSGHVGSAAADVLLSKGQKIKVRSSGNISCGYHCAKVLTLLMAMPCGLIGKA